MSDGPSLETSQSAPTQEVNLLGPFLGHVTASSVKIWLYLRGGAPEIYVTVHQGKVGNSIALSSLRFRRENFWADCITVGNLAPDTRYYYKLSGCTSRWCNASYHPEAGPAQNRASEIDQIQAVYPCCTATGRNVRFEGKADIPLMSQCDN